MNFPLGARRRWIRLAALGLLGCLSSSVAVAQWTPPIVIETVLVGNPGNPPDPLNRGAVPGIGSVGYEYRIGKYEITNAQYAIFLNAVAADDPFGLYNPNMDDSGLGISGDGGIKRSGSPGSHTYEVKPGYADKPVVWVSFWDAARFANWLATGYTEGRVSVSSPLLPGAAYDTNFEVFPSFSAGNRLPGAAVFLPSENEWYKAAFHHPHSAGGPSDDYWLFATRSDTQPTSRPPSYAPNSANRFYYDHIDNGINGGYAVTQSLRFDPNRIYLTNVGAYGPESESYYGTADQNGNVWEWNETEFGSGGNRGLRGGSWAEGFGDFLESSFRNGGLPSYEVDVYGFRIASLTPVPEPSRIGVVLAVAASAAVLVCRRGRGKP